MKTVVFASLASVVTAFTLDSNPVKNAGKKPLSKNTFAYDESSKYLSNKLQTLFPKTVFCASLSPTIDDEKENKELFGGGDPSTYYFEKMKDPERNLADSHAIFGALMKPNSIERYNAFHRVYTCNAPETTIQQEICVADIKIGKNLNGHDGIVHGGLISLLFDDTFGWGWEAIRLFANKEYNDEDFPHVVTANLNVDYRAPLPQDTNVVIRVRHERTEGRKIYMSARMESHDGSILFSEATVLFITVKSSHLS